MLRSHLASLRHVLLRGPSVVGIVLISVISTLLVQRVVAPPRTAAQNSQAQVVRASAFELVGDDGTVLGRLFVGSSGQGALVLNDATGTRRTELNGRGVFNAFDPDGTTPRFRAGYLPATQGSPLPPFNGIQLDAQGSITILPPPSSQ